MGIVICYPLVDSFRHDKEILLYCLRQGTPCFYGPNKVSSLKGNIANDQAIFFVECDVKLKETISKTTTLLLLKRGRISHLPRKCFSSQK